MIYDGLFCIGHPIRIRRLFKPVRAPGRFVRTQLSSETDIFFSPPRGTNWH